MEEPSGIRINKYLSEVGYCSRRAADKLIEQGKVSINGVPATLGDRVSDADRVTVSGKPLKENDPLVYIALNKPEGIVSTTDTRREKDNIIDFVGYPTRIFPIGRLDKNSEGLILLTNDGDIVNRILRARFNHEKEYLVQVNRLIDEDFVRKMAAGVPILDTVTRPCEVELIGPTVFKIILTQGLNRQIRRMCEHFGYRVKKLKRVRIMNIKLDLPVGKWRYLTENELSTLRKNLDKGERQYRNEAESN